jgi:hypothetical protein
MSMPVLPPALTAQLSELVARYILEKRARYLAASVPLSDQQKGVMAGFFRPELLKTTRLVVLTGE